MKHLETTSKTHMKQNMVPPAAMAYLWGTAVANKQRSSAMEREDGGRKAAGVW
jgi:hypothetical protein